MNEMMAATSGAFYGHFDTLVFSEAEMRDGWRARALASRARARVRVGKVRKVLLTSVRRFAAVDVRGS